MEHIRPFNYLGIDINDKYAMISYYQLNMKEPETVGTVAGSEVFQIPLILAKRRDLGQWYYGDDAKKRAKNTEMICIDSLLQRAISGDNILVDNENYPAEDLLALFIRKIMALPQKITGFEKYDRVVVTVERLTKENMDMFWRIVPKLGLTPEQFMVIDHKESFFYFALNQEEELWLHDVFLFEYEKNVMNYLWLKRNTRTTPQVISITEGTRQALLGDTDEEFTTYIQKAFESKIISTVYLVGSDFDSSWMNNSLKLLCRGRRVFMGNNLYSKGACYAAKVRDNEDDWNFIYMGENEMKFNLSLKVKDRGQYVFYNLISAGKNWFEVSGSCDVVMSDTTDVDFWKQMPNSNEATIESLELTDLPERPDRTTRVHIEAKPVSDDKIEITIKDVGFGEMFRGTDKIWHYTMSI